MRHPNKIALQMANHIRGEKLSGVNLVGNVEILEAEALRFGQRQNWTAGLVQVGGSFADALYYEALEDLSRSDPLVDWDAVPVPADGGRRQVLIVL